MLETGPGLFVWACIHWGPNGNGRGAYVSLNLPKKKCLEIVDKIDQKERLYFTKKMFRDRQKNV